MELCRTVLEVVETSLIALFSCYGNGDKVTSTVTVAVHSNERLRTTVTLELASDRPCQQEQFRALVSKFPMQRPHVKGFLSDGAAVVQIEDLCSDICSEGSGQSLSLTLKTSAVLCSDSLEKLLNGLKCHFHKLHLTHPWICFEIKEECPANGPTMFWAYPDVNSHCKTAKVGRKHRIATSNTLYHTDNVDTPKNVQPLIGSTYGIASRWAGDESRECHVSACAFTVPRLRLAKRHRHKHLPADCFLNQVKVLAYGPGRLPIWCESVDSLHMADCVAEWRKFGVTLVPANDRENGSYHVHSDRDDSRNTELGKKRLLVLMLFLDLPESHSIANKLSFVDGLRTRAGDVLSHCSKRLKLASHSALNKLLFNYNREVELTSTISEALPSLSSAVSIIIATSENEEFKAKCYNLLKVEDDSRGEQDELSAYILRSLQTLAQKSVTFAKATPPQARKDGDGASVCVAPPDSPAHQTEMFGMPLQCQANQKLTSVETSTDRLKGTPKAFKSYLCNRYARKRAQDSEAANNSSPKKLFEGAQLRQSDNVSVTVVPTDGRYECEGSRQTDFDDLESWAHLQSPNLLGAGSDTYCADGVVQRPCAKVSPAADGTISQSVLPPLTRVLSEQELPLPTPAEATSSPPCTMSDWEDDLDTLLCEGDDSDCSCSDETDVPLSPGDLTFSSELEMDTDIEGDESQPFLHLARALGTAMEDPLQTAADLQTRGLATSMGIEIPNHTVPEAMNTILDDFDCLDSCAFFDEEESEGLLGRATKPNCHTAPSNSSELNTQWNEFNVQENDFQW